MKNILTYQLPSNPMGFLNILLSDDNSALPYPFAITPGYAPLKDANQPGSFIFGKEHLLKGELFPPEFFDNWEKQVADEQEAYWEDEENLHNLADTALLLQTLILVTKDATQVTLNQAPPVDEAHSFDYFALNLNPTLDLSGMSGIWCAIDSRVIENKMEIHFDIILGNYEGEPTPTAVAVIALGILAEAVSKIDALVPPVEEE